MMASGKNARRATAKRATKGRGKAPSISKRQGLPWLAIGAVTVVLALAVVIGVVVLNKASDNKALATFAPTAENKDPSVDIAGIYHDMPKYKSALHIQPTQRVDYDRYPPVGGPHDGFWAACNGVVYPVAIRDENMVHTLEHGAIWIAYNPKTTSASDVSALTKRVQGEPYMVMSPYPTLADHPISLQAWGHQLQVDSASDPRIDEFITALRRNQYVYPETGATCEQPAFPTTDVPADLQFDPSPRGGDAIPLDGGSVTPASGEDHSQPNPTAPTSAG